MVATAAAYDEGPIAFRYPRGEGVGVEMPAEGRALDIGKGHIVREGSDVAILSYGTRLNECLLAADLIEQKGQSATVADARFAKPLDEDLVRRLAQNHGRLIVIEEGSVGGFGSFVLNFLSREGLLDSGKLKVRTLHLPDIFQDHNSQDKQYEEAKLAAKHIAQAAFAA